MKDEELSSLLDVALKNELVTALLLKDIIDEMLSIERSYAIFKDTRKNIEQSKDKLAKSACNPIADPLSMESRALKLKDIAKLSANLERCENEADDKYDKLKAKHDAIMRHVAAPIEVNWD